MLTQTFVALLRQVTEEAHHVAVDALLVAYAR